MRANDFHATLEEEKSYFFNVEYCIYLLQQAISLENGEGEENGEEEHRAERPQFNRGEEDEEEHRAEWPQFNRGMISECQTQEHGSNDDSRIMEV